MTASLAVSKQMLHSKVARSGSLSPPAPLLLLPPPAPSRSLLLSPAGNPPLLAGPPLLEKRGSVAAMTLAPAELVNGQNVNENRARNPTSARFPTQAEGKARVRGKLLPLRPTMDRLEPLLLLYCYLQQDVCLGKGNGRS